MRYFQWDNNLVVQRKQCVFLIAIKFDERLLRTKFSTSKFSFSFRLEKLFEIHEISKHLEVG